MADVKWIKIVIDIFDDEKMLLIESMPDADTVMCLWFKLLCLAGKVGTNGVLLLNNRIAFTDEMLATIFRRPVNTVRMAIRLFEQYGMIEVIDGTITIPNWSKHQSMDQIEARQAYMRGYMRDKRIAQRQIAAVSACKPNSKPNGKAIVNAAEGELEREEELELERERDKEKDAPKPKSKKKSSSHSDLDFSECPPCLLEALKDFAEFRKSINAELSQKALHLAINALLKMAVSTDEQIEIVNQSIINGWKGLFPIKDRQRKYGNQRCQPELTGFSQPGYADLDLG